MEIRVNEPELIPLSANEAVVVCRERDGKRYISLHLNIFSFYNLNMAMNDVPTPRPTVHQLLANSLNTLSGGVEKVVIDDFKDNIYHSHIYVRNKENDELLAIDAHVTDALILAVVEKCAIYVTEEILKEAEEHQKLSQTTEGQAKNIFENTDWDKVPKA